MAAVPPIRYQGLSKRLLDLQCHFNWNLEDVSPEFTLESRIEHALKKEEETAAGDSPWNYIHIFFMAYLYCEAGEMRKAEKKLDEVKLDALPESDQFKEGLLHVLDSFKAFFSFRQNMWPEAERILDVMVGFECLPAEGRAAVLGFRASSLVKAGVKGNVIGLPYIRQAIELDPDHSDWHFVLGQFLGRTRRHESFFDSPSDEECQELQAAVDLSRSQNVYSLVLLAQTLQEKARYMRANNLGPPRRIAALKSRSVELCERALELEPESPYVNIRCADAFMKSPNHSNSIDRAEQCFERALRTTPDNSLLNHKIGNFYANKKYDYQKAKHHFKIATECNITGNFPAEMGLIDLEVTSNPRFDPIPILSDLLEDIRYNKNEAYVVCIYQLRGICHWISGQDCTRDYMEILSDWKQSIDISAEKFQGTCQNAHWHIRRKFGRELTNLLTKLKRHSPESPPFLEEDVLDAMRKGAEAMVPRSTRP